MVVCGGQESMTRAPHVSYLRSGVKMGDATFKDSMLLDGLTDVFNNIHMGITGTFESILLHSVFHNLSIKIALSLSPAENLASKYNISREEQDEYACESQLRVQKATEAGFFKDEIVPVSVKGSGRNAHPVLVAEDEFPQKNTSVEILSKLRPAFKKVYILFYLLM